MYFWMLLSGISCKLDLRRCLLNSYVSVCFWKGFRFVNLDWKCCYIIDVTDWESSSDPCDVCCYWVPPIIRSLLKLV